MRLRRELMIAVVLAGVTLGVYWPARHYDFVDYDDNIFISENPQVNGGLNWQSFKWALTSPVVANWHPVTTLSHMLDCQLFGVNPGPQHLVNALLHTATAVLLFLLLRRMTGAVWRSALVAALFAWHPLRVESVAWISERKDVLSGFFFMLTLLAYAKYAGGLKSKAQSPKSGPGNSAFRIPHSALEGPSTAKPSSILHPPSSVWYALSLLLFALGLMSKPMLVTLPFVLLLLDFWPLRRLDFRLQTLDFRLLLEKLPFLALSVASSVLTFVLQQHSGAVQSTSVISIDVRLSNAVLSYLRYLWKLVCPIDLAVIYPHPANYYVRSPFWPDWQIPLIALLLAAVSALCLCQLRRRPWVAVGWFWYLVMMLPVIGLVQAGEQAMADRYTYLPLIGPVLSLVWLLAEASGFRPQALASERSALNPQLSTLLSLFPLGACLWLTHRQVSYWQNTVTLFEHAVAVTADNPSAEFSLGVGLEKQGRMSQAMVHYRAALAINPNSYQAHYDLGQLLRKQAHFEAAAEQYQAALRSNPNYMLAHLNLANVLTHLGRNREAAAEYETALHLDPNSLETLNNLAWLLATCPQAEVRDAPRAVSLAERACDLTGQKQTFMLGTLAAAYASAARFTAAVTTAEKACALAAASGNEELLTKNRQLLELYRNGQPYRETP